MTDEFAMRCWASVFGAALEKLRDSKWSVEGRSVEDAVDSAVAHADEAVRVLAKKLNVKAPPVNLLSAGPLMSDVADLVHTHVTKHIGSGAAGLPTHSQSPVVDRLRYATGEELDMLAATWLGRIRDHNPNGTFENDDQFRTRILRDAGVL